MNTLAEIIAAACKVGQVPRAYLLGKRQDKQVREVRTLVVGVALRAGKLHSHIARAMQRDHTTITHHKHKIEGMRGQRKVEFDALVAAVEARLAADVSREANTTSEATPWR